jgi:hypothetical protein
LAITVDALVLRHTKAQLYNAQDSVLLLLERSVQQLQDAIAPPKIVPPVYFYYLDRSRVESLYNQLEPQLEIKEREISDNKSQSAEATAGVGGTKVGARIGDERGSKSTYVPATPLADRKCVEVMRYARDTWPENYFDGLVNWKIRVDVQKADREARAQIDSGKLTPFQPLNDNNRSHLNRPAEADQETLSELRSLRGYVFIEGDFELIDDGKNLILLQKLKLMTLPNKCWFKALLPGGTNLPQTKPLHLTLFGDVIKPLTADGLIDIAPIAIY